jgi:hypothetical protein
MCGLILRHHYSVSVMLFLRHHLCSAVLVHSEISPGQHLEQSACLVVLDYRRHPDSLCMPRCVLLHRVSDVDCAAHHNTYSSPSSHYANPNVLGIATPTMCIMTLLEALIGGPVEVFFAIRVYKCMSRPHLV